MKKKFKNTKVHDAKFNFPSKIQVTKKSKDNSTNSRTSSLAGHSILMSWVVHKALMVLNRFLLCRNIIKCD